MRRRQLLEVTIDIIASEGTDAVTHRRVAELAGVPLGSTTYYFTSREDMLFQALRHFGEQEANAVQQHLLDVTRRPRTARGCADRVLALIAPQTSTDRLRTVAQFALLTEAARRPKLAPVVREWNQTWRSALALMCLDLGTSAADADMAGRTILAMLDGLLLSQLAAPEPNFVTAILKPALRRAFDQVSAV